MLTMEYVVARIDGDYAYLLCPEQPELEEKCVARALLPADIYEGCKLKYEFLQYSMMD